MNCTPLLLFVTILFLFSCGEDCPPDITLGEFPLSDTSIVFIPYSSTDTLIFADQIGNEQFLSSNGIVQSEINNIVRTICSDGLLDGQQELYKVQIFDIAFRDSFGIGNQIFNLTLTTSSEVAESPDANAVFDLLNVSASGFDNLRIITDERQNQVSDNFRDNFLNLSEFLGDTTLFGKNFKDVYEEKSDNGSVLYFNKHRGVVALKFNALEYWVLRD